MAVAPLAQLLCPGRVTGNLSIGGFGDIAVRLVGGDVETFCDGFQGGLGQLVISIVGLLLAFWFVRFLYQRRIFLRF